MILLLYFAALSVSSTRNDDNLNTVYVILHNIFLIDAYCLNISLDALSLWGCGFCTLGVFICE